MYKGLAYDNEEIRELAKDHGLTEGQILRYINDGWDPDTMVLALDDEFDHADCEDAEV